MNLSDALRTATDRQFWNLLSHKIVNMIVDRAQAGKDVDGKTFKPYSDAYRKYKVRGMTRLTDGSKLKAFKGVQISSRSVRPDMTLTGRMLSGLQVFRANKQGATIGWTATESAKVQGNAEQGRKIVNLFGAEAPFARREMETLDREINRRYDKNIRKWARTDRVIRIGR